MRAGFDDVLEDVAREYDLTPKELQVLRLMIQAKAAKEIASLLGIKPATAEVHKAHIRQKLGVRNLAGVFQVVMYGRPERPIREGAGREGRPSF